MGIIQKSLLGATLAFSCMASYGATFAVKIPVVNGVINMGPTFVTEHIPSIPFGSQLPAGEVIVSITANGTFGNAQAYNTAPVGVYINNVPVVDCLSKAVCTNSVVPTPWSYTFAANDLNAFSNNLIELSYLQSEYGAVHLGEITITFTTAKLNPALPTPQPVPSMALFGPWGLASILGIGGIAFYMSRRRKSL